MIVTISIAFCTGKRRKRFVPTLGNPMPHVPDEPRHQYKFYDPCAATQDLLAFKSHYGPNARVIVEGKTLSVDDCLKRVQDVFFDPKVKWGRYIR